MLEVNFKSVVYLLFFNIIAEPTSSENYTSSRLPVDKTNNLKPHNYDTIVPEQDVDLESPIKQNQSRFHEDENKSIRDDKNICMEKVKTKNGFVRGRYLRNVFGDKLCVFSGIPYGQPPVGELRFKRPLPVKNWKNTLEATQIPNAFIQFPIDSVPLSEDCLYLNIWIPLSIFKNRNLISASPAMIWIHGGGFISGSISDNSTNGSILAGRENIIVGSMQYRLGVLGFLYFGSLDAPGNMVLLDQLLALQWFNHNLDQFGGNPNNITLFGESAGAFSIGYHILSKLSRPLFKRAILMSGAPTSTIVYRNQTNAIDFSYDFAINMSCYSMNNNQNLNQVIACLKKIDPYKFLEYSPGKKFFDLPIGVTVDGYFLSDTPENLLNQKNVMFPDIIIGNVYTNWMYLDDGNKNRGRIITAGTDYGFICPYVKFAKILAAKGSNVYFYLFDQKFPGPPKRAPWAATMHGDDIEYIFGTTLINKDRSKEDKALSRNIQKLFTKFTKTGIPSKNWETYSAEHPVFLTFNSTIISDTSTSNIFGPYAADYQFWNYDLLKTCPI